MAVITLTTDWHNDDFYSGAIKGTILSIDPNARIVEISNKISLFNGTQGAFVLRNAFGFFPEGSIHILDLNTEISDSRRLLAFSYRQHFFLGCDNGMLGFILGEEQPDEIVNIQKFDLSVFPSFPALAVLAPAAATISKLGKIDILGTSVQNIVRQVALNPTIGDAVISGSVIYIDSYRNVITNVSKELFDRIGKGRKIEILVQSYHYRITTICNTYNEVSDGELVALFNSAGLLEIAINHGNVADLLNLSINSNIRIKFS